MVLKSLSPIMWLEQGQDRDSDHRIMNFHRILISNISDEYYVLNSLFIEKIHQSFEDKHNIFGENFATFWDRFSFVAVFPQLEIPYKHVTN